MNEDLKNARQIEFEARVDRALERRPEITIPADFAARVARSLPAKEPLHAQIRPVFGQTAGYVALAAMMVVLLVLARIHPEAFEAGRGFVFAVELVLVAQLLAVGFWLGTRSSGA